MMDAEENEYVAAVFANRRDAETAVDELCSLGIADEHLGVAVHKPGCQVFEADVEQDEAHAVEEGALAGVPLGALAGMGLVTLAGLGTVGVGGLLAAGGAAGAIIGGFVGGVVGLATVDQELEESRAWENYVLRPGEILVVARGHHQSDRVRDALQHHGGTSVDFHRPKE